MKIIITANEDLQWEILSEKMDEILRYEKKLKSIYFSTANKLKKSMKEKTKREDAKGNRRIRVMKNTTTTLMQMNMDRILPED